MLSVTTGLKVSLNKLTYVQNSKEKWLSFFFLQVMSMQYGGICP